MHQPLELTIELRSAAEHERHPTNSRHLRATTQKDKAPSQVQLEWENGRRFACQEREISEFTFRVRLTSTLPQSCDINLSGVMLQGQERNPRKRMHRQSLQTLPMKQRRLYQWRPTLTS